MSFPRCCRPAENSRPGENTAPLHSGRRFCIGLRVPEVDQCSVVLRRNHSCGSRCQRSTTILQLYWTEASTAFTTLGSRRAASGNCYRSPANGTARGRRSPAPEVSRDRPRVRQGPRHGRSDPAPRTARTTNPKRRFGVACRATAAAAPQAQAHAKADQAVGARRAVGPDVRSLPSEAVKLRLGKRLGTSVATTAAVESR